MSAEATCPPDPPSHDGQRRRGRPRLDLRRLGRAALLGSADRGRLPDAITHVAEVHRAHYPAADLEPLRRAYALAESSHRGQLRKSGEPYITHPLAVTLILAELGAETTTLTASLLHDTVEDTDVTLDQVGAAFGEEVRYLVDGVTKLEKVDYGAAAEPETFRKMLVATGNDVRVMSIKLADRLHNMRTLGVMRPEKQARIAKVTRDVLIPLAERLGVQALKTELEDLVFAILHPDEYEKTRALVDAHAASGHDALADMTQDVRAVLREARISAEVVVRPRHFISLHRTRRKRGHLRGTDFGRLLVLVAEDADCYGVLGELHTCFTPVISEFKDFIAVPKFNLYQSLHTAVALPQARTDAFGGAPERVEVAEVLIRTHRMHRTAEAGVIALGNPYASPPPAPSAAPARATPSVAAAASPASGAARQPSTSSRRPSPTPSSPPSPLAPARPPAAPPSASVAPPPPPHDAPPTGRTGSAPVTPSHATEEAPQPAALVRAPARPSTPAAEPAPPASPPAPAEPPTPATPAEPAEPPEPLESNRTADPVDPPEPPHTSPSPIAVEAPDVPSAPDAPDGERADPTRPGWLSRLLAWQQAAPDPDTFWSTLREDLAQDREITVFRSDGGTLGLPAGASCVDAAYAQHGEGAHACIGVRVNGRLARLSTVLGDGDTVQLLMAQDPTSGPSRDWLEHARTPTARIAIGRWLASHPEGAQPQEDAPRTPVSAPGVRPAAANAVVDLPGATVRLAGCCTPVPPDRVTAFAVRGGAVTVHREECTAVTHMKSAGRTEVGVRWGESSACRVTLFAESFGRPHLLADLTEAIAVEGVAILSAKVEPPSEQRVRHTYTLELPNAACLPALMRAMREVPGVYDVSRAQRPTAATR